MIQSSITLYSARERAGKRVGHSQSGTAEATSATSSASFPTASGLSTPEPLTTEISSYTLESAMATADRLSALSVRRPPGSSVFVLKRNASGANGSARRDSLLSCRIVYAMIGGMTP